MSNDYVLAIDFGTQSVRAIILNDRGMEICKAKVPFTPYFSLNSGWAEQHPEIYWDNLVKAIHRLKEEYPLGFERIVAVGVTTIRDTITFVDKDNKVLRPFLVWLDERECSRVEEVIPFSQKILLHLVKMYEPYCGIRKVTKMNWVHENEPDIWNNTHKIIQLSGYINYRLTGKLLDSMASQRGHLPFDYKHQRWQTKKVINTYLTEPRSREAVSYAIEKFDELTGVLGLLYDRKQETLDSEIEALIEQRQQARKNRDFAEADRIRDELKAKGIELKDTPQGVQWSRIG